MKKQALAYMLRALGNGECINDYGQVSLTQLAENTAHELGHDEWLDDETHWVWEEAINAAKIRCLLEED